MLFLLLLGLFGNKLSSILQNPKTFEASALVESGAGQDTGSCMQPILEMPYDK